MKDIWNVIFFILCLALAQTVRSFSIETIDNEETIPFTVDMLPILVNITSVNSTSIGGFWKPSPSIEGINLTELEGLFSAGIYVLGRRFTSGSCTIKGVVDLNETGEYVFDELEADTVYQVCYHTEWYAPHEMMACFQPKGLYYRHCQLFRTYTKDDTTLNPVPVFGEYTWMQIMTSANTLAIVVNTSVSSELPYYTLNITVTLGSEKQSQLLNMSLGWANFTFDGFDLEPKDYPLSITYTSIDTSTENLRSATNTLNETITITVPTLAPG